MLRSRKATRSSKTERQFTGATHGSRELFIAGQFYYFNAVLPFGGLISLFLGANSVREYFSPDHHLMSAYDVEAFGGGVHAATLEVVGNGTGGEGRGLHLLYGGGSGRLYGMEGSLVDELVGTVAGPVEREAYEAHGVATEDAVLLIVDAQCTVGEHYCGAVGRAMGTDGLRRTESGALVG